jgi:pyruvate dehydrogenase E1 component beta subunit
VASGLAAHYSLQAARKLAGEGIDAEVIDLRTLVPLDVDTILSSIAKTHRVVVANDGHRNCGFAAEIMAMIMERGFDDLDAPVARVARDDVPVPYAAKLEQAVLITAHKIADAVRKLIGA